MQYVFGNYTLDTERYELRRSGTRVKLQPKVFEVLTYLIEHRERLVSKQELLEQLWPQQFVGETTLSSCIRAVRRAVGDTGQAQRVIQTLHGRAFASWQSSRGIARSGARVSCQLARPWPGCGSLRAIQWWVGLYGGPMTRSRMGTSPQ
jgi:Transcriptional regulatory protein, C terminal